MPHIIQNVSQVNVHQDVLVNEIHISIIISALVRFIGDTIDLKLYFL